MNRAGQSGTGTAALRALRNGVLLVLAGLLSACGGGGGSGSTPSTPTPTPTVTYALSVAVTGSGSVTSSPAGIDCGSTCSASYASGTQVTLTAAPASGASFSGWSGACSGSTTTCTITMNQAQSVSASFVTAAASNYTLSLSVSGNGTVTSSPAGIDCGSTCSASYASGTQVTLTATPASGASFSGWSGACAGTSPSCTVTMNQAQSVSASFGGGGSSGYTFDGVPVPWKIWQPGNVSTPVCSASGCTTYYVSPTGSDSNNGTTLATAFATPQHAADIVQAGDTVLIAAGTYHGTLNLINGATGTAGKPITFGSLGNGPVIIDASPVINAAAWKQVQGSVWQAPLAVTPGAIVINNVPLKPALTSAYTASDSPPPTAASLVTPGSGLWAYNAGVLTVDFGSATPSTANVVIPSESNQATIYWYNKNYLIFNGLTSQGSGAGGIWGYGSNVTVSNCNAQFNIKGGISFMSMQGNANANNQALYNRVYQNAILNWPRGNNGYAYSGGGWSGGLVFTGSLNGLARGNVVYDNGGEGIISYGSSPGTQTGGTVFEQNVSMDNWSANMYFDNQPNDIARQNIVYFSGYNPSTWIHPYDPNVYPWNTMYKFNAGIGLGDECGSSGADPCTANLANIQVYNNLIVGFRIGIQEYWEGNAMQNNPTNLQHGLKNVLIANNTIILPPTTPPGTYSIGLYLWNNTTPTGGNPNTNSFVVNNLIVGFDGTEPVIWYQGHGADPGVTVNNNAYWNAGATNVFNLGFNTVANDTFAQWQAASGNDVNGIFANPQLANLAALVDPGYPNTPVSSAFSYLNAAPTTGSPLIGKGQSLSQFSTNLTGAVRSGPWTIGAF